MATIIIAWEYERDFSHLERLKRLQRYFASQGHAAYLAGIDVPHSLDDAHLPFLSVPRAAPPSIHQSRTTVKIGGFGDRLALLGFNDASVLANQAAAWDTLFDLLKPRLLISDCAPVACLAAYQRIPCVQLSDGMSLPPAHLNDFPRLRTDAAPLAATHVMLKNVQQVMAARKQAIPDTLPAILGAEHVFITHIPEFDPYLTFRRDNVSSGPFLPLPVEPGFNDKPDFFACVDLAYPDMEEIIIGLSELDKRGIFYIPNISYALKQFLTQAGMHVCDSYPDLHEVLSRCAFAIHHGSLAVAEAALAAGVPQFTLPAQFESDWISHYLVNLGVAKSIYPDIHPLATTSKKINAAMEIRDFKHKYSLREWAELRARHLRQKAYEPLEKKVVNICKAILQ